MNSSKQMHTRIFKILNLFSQILGMKISMMVMIRKHQLLRKRKVVHLKMTMNSLNSRILDQIISSGQVTKKTVMISSLRNPNPS